jgi:DNA-binding NarL/FixJ family response regulator
MEALRHASRERPQARIVVFSGLDDPDSVEQAYASGAAAYLSKDAPPEEMLATIRKLGRS